MGCISELSLVRGGMGILPMSGKFPKLTGGTPVPRANTFGSHRQLGDAPHFVSIAVAVVPQAVAPFRPCLLDRRGREVNGDGIARFNLVQ